MANPRSHRVHRHRWTRAFFGLGLVVFAGTAQALEATPAKAPDDTLNESRELLRQFPFTPNCDGNTQEMVACLWQRRNQQDGALMRALANSQTLEQWRSSRRKACEVAAAKAKGGSVYPIVWLSCEIALNKELLRQISRPLLDNADL
jgi:hypothetical protein